MTCYDEIFDGSSNGESERYPRGQKGLLVRPIPSGELKAAPRMVLLRRPAGLLKRQGFESTLEGASAMSALYSPCRQQSLTKSHSMVVARQALVHLLVCMIINWLGHFSVDASNLNSADSLATMQKQATSTSGLSDELPFIDPNCQQLPYGSWNGGTSLEISKPLMILKCDLSPMLHTFELLLARSHGPKQISTPSDVTNLSEIEKTEKSSLIWADFLNLDSMIDHFFSEAKFAIERKEFCAYPTITRLSRLKPYTLGSKLLSLAYDILTIEYHISCLFKALNRLPPVPYLVRDVVDIYVDGADKSMPDLNANPSLSDESGEFLSFDVEAAIDRNGPLEDVVALVLTSGSSGDRVEEFKASCKGFLMELEERWQSMDMMSQMLSTDGNGIQRFNNYVIRTLIPTKYADACSQLSFQS